MICVLHPTKWYYPTSASDPIACRYEGWVDYGIDGGIQWVVIDVLGEP